MEAFDKRKRLEGRRELAEELRQAERLALVPARVSEELIRREVVSVRRPSFGGWRVG